MIIRNETPSDFEAITEITLAAFNNCPYGNHTEQFSFRNLPELILEGVPQEVFLALPFDENKTQGVVVFHEGFKATDF